MIWGDVVYGQAAYNLAMSIKSHSDIPIHLVTQPQTVNGIPLDYFDKVEYYHHPVSDPGLFKSQVYEKLPFKYNLYLDADALCVAPLEPLIQRLIDEGKPYRCFVHTYYGKESENAMPLMVWAYKDHIWHKYGFVDEKLPATQSSLQFIEKCEWSEMMFNKFQENFTNPIPLQDLRYAWGGGQPDELYLNITLAQLGYDPSLGDGIYFGNEYTIPRPHQIAEKHPLLSMFGTTQNIKPIYVKYYDGSLSNIAKSFGHKTYYQWKNIAAKKHANKRIPNMNRTRRTAMAGKFFRETPFNYKPLPGKVLLCTSFYESTNPIRQAEFDKCRESNLNNPEIDKVLNLGTQVIDHPKVINLFYERPTYNDFLKEAYNLKKEGKNSGYTIIANSDIYFDNTLNWIKQINMDKTMIALSRWDVDNNGYNKLFAYEWSQDTWIFKDLPEGIGKYALGLPGCDNKFAYEVSQLGYDLINPSKDIKTYHLHNSNARNYNENDRLPPPYKEIPIQTLSHKVKPTVGIKQPGKVGDIINCLPIAKEYAKDHLVFWECPKQYHYLFDYVDYVTPVEKFIGKTVDLSFGLDKNSPTNREWQRVRNTESFVSVKYRLAGVGIENLRNLVYTRKPEFEISLNSILNPREPFALVHDSSDYGTPPQIETDLKVVKFEPLNGYSIFDWRLLIENATEIHCIDSSLCNFVDVVKPSGKLFYYKTDRVPLKGDETILTADWIRVGELITQ